MSNILRVTTPVAGYDNTNGVKVNPQNNQPQTNVQGQVMPDKVVRPDARSDAGSQQSQAELKFRYETNFDNFIQQVLRSPSLTEEFSSAFLEKLATFAQSGLKADFAQEISNFLSMISMSPQDLGAFLKMQAQSAVRFNGALFEILRQIMKQTASVELRSGILDFLKKYTDLAEGNHLLENIRHTQQNIKGEVFRNAREQLEQMEGQLNYNAAKGDVRANADVLKNRILPFLNQYITTTHDRGNLREDTAMLAALIARYENGDAGRMQEAFMRLMDFQGFSKYFQNLEPDKLFAILANTEFEKAAQNNDAMNRFADIIQKGVMGEAGSENKAVFKALMQAFLLNESVYMPVLHLTLPLNLDGTMMFSELWIDPNDKQGRDSGDPQDRVVRGLIKFDIQDVGFFDLFFLYAYNGDKVSIQLNYPKSLAATENEIRGTLEKILAENGLKSEELVLGSEEGSIPISEAFPHIFERKNSINVRI